jgi:hypothetical protein
MAARKKAKKPLKKNQYRCIGGPVEYLHLPGLERGDYKTQLPDVVAYVDEDSHYARRYDPESDTSYYEWTEK